MKPYLAIITLMISGISTVYGNDQWDTFFKKHGKGKPVTASKVTEMFRAKHADKFNKVEFVNVKGMPFKKALRFTVTKRPRRSYMLQVTSMTTSTLKNGDVVIISLYAKTLSTANESGYGTLKPYLSQSSHPWKSFTRRGDTSIDTKWTKINIPAIIKTRKDLKPGEARIAINAGFNPQVVDVGGVKVMNYGAINIKDIPQTKVTYEGRALDDPWRKAAAQRIEKYRKGDMRIKVIDLNGKPVKNAKVDVKMVRHSFPFGCAFNAKWYFANKNTDDGRRYAEEFKNHFTRAVHIGLLKWPYWEADRKLAVESVKWMRENGLEVRGHCLIWPRWDRTPWFKDEGFKKKMEENPKELRKLLTDHIKDEVGELQGMCVDWDVYNEPYSHYRFVEILGDNAINEWFNTAKSVDPKANMTLNEGGHLSRADLKYPQTENYIKIIKYMQKNNAKLDQIGFEAHFDWKVPHPQKVYDMIDYFSKEFKLPIAITEFDQVVSDEKLQADWQRDFMTITFSHPAVNQFIMWGFWNGISKRGFYRKNWSLKPNGKVWRDLVFSKWWTNKRGTTNSQGMFDTRGFLGDYKVTVEINGRTKTVPVCLIKDGIEITVKL